jgi:hypothetical protein
MISARTMQLMALTATLFTAGPIVAEHQAFAAHHPQHKGSGDYPHYPNNLGRVGYGPCFQGKFSWCLKRF